MNLFETGEMIFLACPMCMSGADGQTVLAANLAIAALLVVLCVVLMSFLSFIVFLAKRSARNAEVVGNEAVAVMPEGETNQKSKL